MALRGLTLALALATQLSVEAFSFGGAVEMIDEGWSFYKVEIQVEPGSTHHYVFSIPTSPGAPELVSRPPLGSSCDVGEAHYGFVAPSTCGGVLSLPAYEWQNGCACAGCFVTACRV